MIQQVNLYHPIFRREIKIFSANAIGIFLLLVVASLLAYYGLVQWQTARLEQNLVELESRLQKQEAALIQLREQQSSGQSNSKLLTVRLHDLEQRLSEKRKVLSILSSGGISGNNQGFSELLLSFSEQHTKGIWLEYLEIANGGSTMEIQGNALSVDKVPEYIRNLSQDEAFDGRKFEVFQITREKEKDYVSFLLGSKIKS